jgi:Co/Zn/Cd efflux system component
MKTCKRKMMVAGAMMVGLLWTVNATAAESIGSMMTNITQDLSSAPKLIMLVAALLGLIAVVMGVAKFMGERHKGQETGHAVRLIIAGVALLSLSGIIAAVSTTTYGSNKTDATINSLNM